MKYTGRIYITSVAIVSILVMRIYGSLFYNFPLFKFPIFGVIVLLVFWWFGKKYDLVKFLSEKDVLTKLYNRRYVIQRFPKLKVWVDRKNEQLTLFLIDIDNFKLINDTYGHKTGDLVLQQLSESLSKEESKHGIVARWSGDEFLIILPFTDVRSNDSLISRIHNELKKSSEETRIDLSVSIGSSQYPNDAKTLEALLHIADQNMYKLKSERKNNAE